MKKTVVGILVFISYSSLIITMESACSLTDQEKKALRWFEKISKKIPSVYDHLSEESKEVFEKGLNYQEYPAKVIQSRCEYIEKFYDLAENNNNITIEYAQEILYSAFLKGVHAINQTIQQPTDLFTARSYVYSQLLTPAEQATWEKENYLKNPHDAHKVTVKYSDLLAEQLAKLSLIMPEEKNKKAVEIFNTTMNGLKKTYLENKN